MNIPETWQKIKGTGKWLPTDMAMPLLVILVGFGSFGLGRMSALESVRPPITISQTASVAEAVDAKGLPDDARLGEAGGKVVASKTGTKYHFPWCAGATKISEKNKVWFDDEITARAAGYTPAGNCKGLK